MSSSPQDGANNRPNLEDGRDDDAQIGMNVDVADTGVADIGPPAPDYRPVVPPSPSIVRPQLARDQPIPPPPDQPPPQPAPSPQQTWLPEDSLSLQQLKKIVNDFPRTNSVVYAFEYSDAASLEEELDEWFLYGDVEKSRLHRVHETFDRRWKKFDRGDWFAASKDVRSDFMTKELAGLSSSNFQKRFKCTQTILYVALGAWYDTAGILNDDEEDIPDRRSAATPSQSAAIKDGVMLIAELHGISRIYDIIRRTCDRILSPEFRAVEISPEERGMTQEVMENATSILYVIIEAARAAGRDLMHVTVAVSGLQPDLLDYLVSLLARLRWEDTTDLSQGRLFLLCWKTLLLVFGGKPETEAARKLTRESGHSAETITASPLDYHMFRQEITSKYPAYVPPAPLLPLEATNSSILPPLPNHRARNPADNGVSMSSSNTGGASILHQPVHIATPAPSPPPSPSIGGKAGKKQNYQTNQNFPFMYPPLDSTSNSAGGKGLAGLQEALVGRKWEGSEIPASILEAGELFAERTKMTRATRQLWDERERFRKFERGWDVEEPVEDAFDFDIEELELDFEKVFARRTAEKNVATRQVAQVKVDFGPKALDDETKARLCRLEVFYRNSLPHLQSLIIVLLKAVLVNVSALLNPIYSASQAPMAGGPKAAEAPLPASFHVKNLPTEELEALRQREITSKAVSGILLLLLKWFKVSHVLKFEYLTQLLLDANYMPLILKLFAHSEIDKVVDSNAERPEETFFHFCNMNSARAERTQTPQSSEDEAVPPPIKRNRSPSDTAKVMEDPLLPLAYGESSGEAGLPISDSTLDGPDGDMSTTSFSNDAPLVPRTDYSWRNFFSTINYLRIMQKLCKHKAHRNLLLVQYKSSNILKKALKVPQHELRLYTLKLFKNQVPYCGRKWRQQNMRVITSIYLHCKPELRDDWLAGSDIDGEIEESLPLEQALRGLTHWYNVNRYPEQMGVDKKMMRAEQDFFLRELERLEIDSGDGTGEEGDDISFDF